MYLRLYSTLPVVEDVSKSVLDKGGDPRQQGMAVPMSLEAIIGSLRDTLQHWLRLQP